VEPVLRRGRFPDLIDLPRAPRSILNHRIGRNRRFATQQYELEHLKRLPVNELKIDKSFVMAMDRDPADRAIVASTAALGSSLGLHVVAEGVESAASASVLRAIGCDHAQGFHYSPPVPGDQIPGLVQAAVDAQVGVATVSAPRPSSAAA